MYITQYNRISKNLCLLKLHLFLFISIIVFANIFPTTIFYINQYIRTSKNFNFLELLPNHLLNASRVKEGCRTTKSSLSIGIIFKGISTVFIYFLCHIFIPLILELPSDSWRLQSINDKKSGTAVFKD